MIQISAKVLASMAAVLGAILVFLSAYSGNVKVTVAPAEEAFGAVSVLTSPQDWNGVTRFSERRTFRAGTSTVISYAAQATSTVTIICWGGPGMAAAQEYEIAVGTTPNATSTFSFGKMYIPSNGSAGVIATTTSFIIGKQPQLYVNVKMATTSGTTVGTALAPTGSCTFVGQAI